MSETNNIYWNGEQHAVLTRENISADWGSGEHSGTRIDAANRAFCIWYHGQKTLSESASDDHYSLMYRSLNDCATSGSGFGVSDLQEALDHMATNDGRWTDGNTRNYYGGTGKAYQRGFIMDMPEACANFLEAVDNELPKLRTAMEQYRDKCQALNTLRPSPQQSTTEWEQLKSNIDAIKTAAERVEPLLWLVPATVRAFVPNTPRGLAGAQRIEAFADAASPRVERAVKFLDVVGNIHDAMTVYVQATRAMGGDRRAGLAFAALGYAMTYVPVLGGFYGEIIRRIPGLIENWRDFMNDYHARLNNPIAWLSSRPRVPTAWRCSICGSSGGY